MTVAEDLIADARTHATDTTTAAIAAMAAAWSVLQGLGAGPPTYPPSIRIDVPSVGDPGDVPVYTGSTFESRTFDGVRPNLFALPDLALPAAPGEPPEVLEYDPPARPEGEPNADLLGSPPAVNDELEVPAAPDLLSEISGIQKPTLINITVPTAPTYSEPEFLATRPVLNATAPTDLDVMMRDQYSTISPVMRDAVASQFDAFMDREFPAFRTGMAAIEERLATYLEGGTALSTAIENALYNRTLDKTNADATRANQKAWGEAARAGFQVPSAILLAQLIDLDQERRNANARAAIDIAIEQAKLEQQNLQFAVTQSSNLRQIALNAAIAYYNGLVQINGQALEYARSVVDAYVKSFDIAAKYAEMQARIYEAEARVYEARLKGALGAIEAYIARVRGLEAQANINMAQVNAYRARLEAVQAEAAVYKSSVDAVTAQAQIERLKVELYQARVQGYTAQVNALSARYNGYEAAVRGEAAKVQASAEAVRAFSAKVQAYGEVVKAKTAELESRTRGNESLIRAYQVDVEAYAALSRAEAEGVRAEIDSFSATVHAYTAKAQAISEKSRAEIAAYQTGLQAMMEQAKLFLEHLRQGNALDVARVTGMANVAVAAGNVYAAQAQAALAGMNTLAADVLNTAA